MSSKESKGASTKATAATNKAGITLLKVLAKESKDPNVFISPASIEICLAMTANGARDKTLDEMKQVLGLSGDMASVNDSFKSLVEVLASKEVTLNVANSIWADDIKKEFDSTLSKFYGSHAYPMAGKDVINKWCAEQTKDKIKEPLSEDPDKNGMVLVNAVYFKGDWMYKFDEKQTKDAEFTATDGKAKSTVKMMSDSQHSYRYHDTNEMQIIDLPYAHGEFTATIILPRNSTASTIKNDDRGKKQPKPKVTSMAEMLKLLTPEVLNTWVGDMRSMQGTISLPRFKSEFGASLNPHLIALGMPTAFSDKADFGLMTNKGGLVIDNCFHKTFVEVNEVGTEAAAITTMVMATTSCIVNNPPSFTMVCDHPFIFMIRHRNTGLLLFLGIIDKPIA